MAFWLVKTEPDSFSYDDLVRLGRDRWNGVRNPVAIRHIKAMRMSDMVFIYHTGKQKAIVGVAEVVSQPYPDPEESSSRFVVADLAPRYALHRPVTLAEIKRDPNFAGWELTFQPRLSVMPVSEGHWRQVHKIAGHSV